MDRLKTLAIGKQFQTRFLRRLTSELEASFESQEEAEAEEGVAATQDDEIRFKNKLYEIKIAEIKLQFLDLEIRFVENPQAREYEIASLELEIKGYKIEYEHATSKGIKEKLRDQIRGKELRLLTQQLPSYQRTLRDGFPPLEQTLTRSGPYIPDPKEHAECGRVVMDFPFLPQLTNYFLSAPNHAWDNATENNGIKSLSYATVGDIAFHVRSFLQNLLRTLQLPLQFRTELTIQKIKSDIFMILMGEVMVGGVAVKKPGEDVLNAPTVLGELLDQMLLVEGFYEMGPVIGILATAEEWLISWFPSDTDTLLSHNADPEDDYSTLVKQKPTTDPESKTDSPPRDTPSQQSSLIHHIEADENDLPGPADNTEVSQEMERLLCTTEVMNIHHDALRVLQHLCGAFQIMSKSKLHFKANISRCLPHFHKDIETITFHPHSIESVNFNKFPNSNTKTLVAFEDLGRGSTGKAWLCCATLPKPRPSCCVLKFDNANKASYLQTEKQNWDIIYPEFSEMVKVERWSGADALVMPHFTKVPEHDREKYREELLETLTTKFGEKRKVHQDVEWRNIGVYHRSDGTAAAVVFDLLSVNEYNVAVHYGWIDKAMKGLYGAV